ncbi:glutathione S-transferase N-terminal domain-containing protein [Phenylobacterium soli]|uniref:Glutathione S-transferase n=1 Tax=Phenylobacterium soli TaxID=2170551 RepID=A0A328AEL6_9CAUL|nr:glutathione S-transferase family protein [Phenylobacterium soli]RAK53071.1 glutathione S-transferase [Phenylobacterium soli]
MYRLYGGLGSPYSLKMRAVLRYRRIPHIWLAGNGPDVMGRLFSQLKAPVIPVLEFPDGTVMNDSTPLIRELERRLPGERTVVPEDEAQAFLAWLLEDMADEWGTKAMFHYRWFRERDQLMLGRWLAFDRLAGAGRQAIEQAGEAFRERQVGRMALVGCTPANAPLIEATAKKVFDLLDPMATDEGYLFGSRPSVADFGWYGQLSQLASDPTPHEVMAERAPFLMRWLANLDDASGVDGRWRDPPADPSAAVIGLLKMAGEIYLPFLLANAAAAQAGEETFTVELWGQPYSQGTFRYQVKCLAELRAAYAGLSAAARKSLDPLLEDAGLRAALAGG